ncbi:FIST C-terminal domain-containing protein, partial [bacterium]|nr:FIST C-terminal domain-containing protein [bacterium]
LGKLAQLVLLFCGTSIIKNQLQFDVIKESFPMAVIVGCSTAGEIFKTRVDDDSLVLTAIHFEHTTIKEAHVRLSESCDSLKAGETLAKSLYKKDLVHVFTLSDGLVVNGSDLVKGLTENLPENVMVTGGMSGDGENFNETFIYWGKAPEKGAVLAIGFYGDRLKVGFGSLGGWDSFGTERLITKAEGNILFELDGQSALELYKKYLGDHAKGLPATGLLFPLSLRGENGEEGTVRTILAINEEQQSLTFAGDVPEGTYARFMKANFDRLIDGAIVAAKIGYEAIGSISPDLAILISCVGRKMVLKQRIEEEVEGAGEILGENVVLTGFYSYGEISPLNPGGKCALHNQTMAITTFFEE